MQNYRCRKDEEITGMKEKWKKRPNKYRQQERHRVLRRREEMRGESEGWAGDEEARKMGNKIGNKMGQIGTGQADVHPPSSLYSCRGFRMMNTSQ